MSTHGETDRIRAPRLEQRALALWPRLDRRAVRRCAGDTRCLVRLVSRRTALSPDTIWRLLVIPRVSEDEGVTWFG